MAYSFDTVIDRTQSSSTKWSRFDADVLPFWVADMDFAAPEFILDALRDRLEHPILGYTQRPDSLNRAFCDWLSRQFDWNIEDDWIVWVPGVVPALNLATQTLKADRHVIIPTPVYHPFLDLARNADIRETRVPLIADNNWRMDLDAMQASLTPETRMVLICNPQNPTARCYSREELAELAEFIVKNDLLLVSDEIHCNIVLDPDAEHIPIAALDPRIAERTITLYAATKIYNIPGVSCAAAVIPDEALRTAFMEARRGLVHGIGPLGFEASEAAFNDTSTWIPELIEYLRENLTLVRNAIGNRMGVHEGTYLAWINVADLRLDDTEAYFAEHGLGISPGAQFGAPDYIRFNFACPRTTLIEGLERLQQAIAISV